jgi:hypothetical protein
MVFIRYNKKQMIVGISILLVALVTEIFFFNFKFFYYSNSTSNLPIKEISQQSFIAKDLKVNGDSSYTSLTNDPWLEVVNLNMQVKTIDIELEHSRPQASFQVFYTIPTNKIYSEPNSSLSIVSSHHEKIYLNFNNLISINSLRLDVTDKAGDTVKIKKVTINEPYTFSFDSLRFLFIFCLMVISYVLYLFVMRYKQQMINYRYYISLVVFLILVLGNIHGSSIGMWDKYIVEETQNDKLTTIVGEPRTVRSDEWLVQTPWFLSQTQNDNFFPIRNNNIRSDGQNMLIANVPTLSIHLLAKPQFWGFVLFGKDYGLSWYWMLRILLLLMLSFEMAMFLSNKNLKISVVGSLCISLSPVVQWWYNTSVVDLIIYMQGAVVSALYYVKSSGNHWPRVTYMVLMTLSLLGFVFVLYPPIQVPLGYLLLIFIGFIMVPHIRSLISCKTELISFIACILFASVSIFSFIYQSMDDMKIMLHTEYPGQRVITGGSFELKYLQSYLINWLFPYKDVTFLNNSELSNFINFLPAILLSFIAIYRHGSHHRKLILSLFFFLLFQISWLIFSYPLLISKLTLFSYVTEIRLGFIMVGLTSVYLFIWLASIIAKQKVFRQFEALFICSLVALVYYISLFHSEMHNYLGNILSWFSIIFFLVLNYTFLRGKLNTLVVLMLVVIIVSGSTVNPVAKGTFSIYNKEVSQQLMRIKQLNPSAKWASVNSLVNSQYMVALGMKTFNSVHFYPDLKLWTLLDPNKEFNHVYNRFAHITVSLTTEKTSFQLIQTDVIEVHLNVEDLKKVGIDYILSQGELREFESTLKKVYYSPKDNLYIYQVI